MLHCGNLCQDLGCHIEYRGLNCNVSFEIADTKKKNFEKVRE